MIHTCRLIQIRNILSQVNVMIIRRLPRQRAFLKMIYLYSDLNTKIFRKPKYSKTLIVRPPLGLMKRFKYLGGLSIKLKCTCSGLKESLLNKNNTGNHILLSNFLFSEIKPSRIRLYSIINLYVVRSYALSLSFFRSRRNLAIWNNF